MSKTGPELRHDAKERMKKYRAEMIDKGYTSTTIFLSQEHRDELKRLGEEHRLTRAEAAEHIFKVYLESENKNITQTYNIDTENQAKIFDIIESLQARVEVLENQIEKIEDREQDIETSLDIFETEDNDGIDLELEIELDDSENKDKQTDELGAVIEQPADIPEAIVYDGLILEADDSKDKNETQTDNMNKEYQVEPPDAMPEAEVKDGQDEDQTPTVEPAVDVLNTNETQTNNTNTKQESETPTTPDIEPTDKPISETQAEMFDTLQEPVEPKPDQDMELPDYLIGVDPDMPIEERHKIILRLAEDFPGRGEGTIGNTQKRIDMLNTASILLNGKPWKKPKQFADQLSIARRWSKKQVEKS